MTIYTEKAICEALVILVIVFAFLIIGSIPSDSSERDGRHRSPPSNNPRRSPPGRTDVRPSRSRVSEDDDRREDPHDRPKSTSSSRNEPTKPVDSDSDATSEPDDSGAETSDPGSDPGTDPGTPGGGADSDDPSDITTKMDPEDRRDWIGMLPNGNQLVVRNVQGRSFKVRYHPD
ncbi:hypothetical protein IAR55_001317 [Kwoniella newhampshirensis]|uniref:Uncharacterized protein n=1 Tax=Kwoniella newhampshirensis TaxID=1651941 RepID=A0AAW0Z622_9TREE